MIHGETLVANVGRKGGLQPYRKQSASRNTTFWKESSGIGSAVSHVEPPTSWEISIAFCSELGRVVSKLLASLVMFFTASFASNCASAGSSLYCWMTSEVRCWDSALFTGLTMPSPPSRVAGRESFDR